MCDCSFLVSSEEVGGLFLLVALGLNFFRSVLIQLHELGEIELRFL